MVISKRQIVPDSDFGQIFLVTRRTARNITMRVKEDGLHVTTPPYRSARQILEAIAPFRERLLRNRKLVEPTPFDFNFSITTECFRLRLAPGKLKRFTVRSTEDEVVIFCPENTDFSDGHVQTLVRNAVMRAMKKRAEEYLPPLLDMLSRRFDLPYSKVKITRARSRWGSCSASKVINLSFYLMLLPAHLMDYVLLHELSHTKEMNHGPRFWELLNRMTDGQALSLRKELRNYHTRF